MSANTQHTDQSRCELDLVDSVMGSAKACENISKNLDNVMQTTAGCLSEPLGRLATEFRRASESYQKNVTLFVNFTQHKCQQIATEIPTILERHGQWTVKAEDGSCYRLNVLSKCMRLHRMYHELMVETLKLIESSGKQVVHRPASTCVNTSTDYHRRQRQEAAWKLWMKEERACSRSFAKVDQALERTRECSKDLRGFQVAEALPQMTDPENLPMMDDWSTTQSTTGIMTPAEGWSDLGSETTEICHTNTITRHSLQLCGYATANFLRLIKEIQRPLCLSNRNTVEPQDCQRLHKAFSESIVQLLHALDAPVPSQRRLSQIPSARSVTYYNLLPCIVETESFLQMNNAIEESFGHLPGSTPVGTADIEVMHKAFNSLVEKLRFNLAAPMPFQDEQFTLSQASAPALAPVPVPVSNPDPEVLRSVVPGVQSNSFIDKSLEAIINSMEPMPTDRDIAKLVFHWTTLDEYYGSRRAEVMQFD